MAKIIMGIQLENRMETAKKVQDLLTQYGCFIKTRLGVHQTAEGSCSEKGLIIIEFMNNADKEAQELEEALLKIENTTVKRMKF
ncbi:MAG: hypothetical protein GXW85_00250 [Clostridia bacterium]|nr:hypothetical protein [Clostridia bacterium]